MTMTNDQDLIDAHIDGKIDARELRPHDPASKDGSGEGQFYMRGYYEETKRMESAAYCRMRGLPIRVSSYYASDGGSCATCC